jgi:phage shock protein C
MMADVSNLSGRKLVRPREGRYVAGVAAGLAEYLGVDVTLVRVIFAVAALIGLLGILAYLAAWVLIPEEGEKESIAERLVSKDGTRSGTRSR